MTPDDDDDHDLETAGAGARAQPRAAAAVPEAASSNTASGKYTGVIDRLRQGIDSLYLSYRGVIYSGVEEELKALKTLAQHPKRHEQSGAQYVVGNHVFEVTSKGGPGFPFTLRDNAFAIKISTSKNGNYPLAYVQISSRYLSAVTPQAAEAELQSVVDVLGEVEGTPTVSRADLFVDFLSSLPVNFRHPEVWITRAREKRPFYDNDKLTGWTIGPGGRINCRLYDKTIEIKQSKKEYLKELWAQEGYFSGDTVWRLEYELQRAFLAQMGIRGLPQLLASLGSL